MRIRTSVLALTAATAACIAVGETERKIQALLAEPASTSSKGS